MKRMGSTKKSLHSNNSDINNIYKASDYMTLNGGAYGDVIAGMTPTGKKSISLKSGKKIPPRNSSPF